jgi:Uma2 family endonuclease
MIAEIDKTPIAIEQFLDGYPENSQSCYELRRGIIVEMAKPRGKHSEIAGFLIKSLNAVIDDLQVPYFIPRESIIKISNNTGYEPDVTVIKRPNLVNEPQWEKASVIEKGESVALTIGVRSLS